MGEGGNSGGERWDCGVVVGIGSSRSVAETGKTGGTCMFLAVGVY